LRAFKETHHKKAGNLAIKKRVKMSRSYSVSFIFAVVLTACANQAVPVADAKPVDVRAVKEVVLDYFQGQGEASELRMNRAFASEIATMVTVSPDEEGQVSFVRREMSEIIPLWASNTNPPGASTDYEFMSLNIIDGRLATVTFRSRDRFYDALTLMKSGNEWRIVSKVYVRQ